MDNQEPVNPTPKPPKSGGMGPVVSIIIIIILLALGGLYYFTTGINQIPSYNSENADGSQVVADLEQDLDATSFDEVDTLLDDIDADLEQI